MTKRIGKVLYDTDNAIFIARHCEGSIDDSDFVSESLYVKRTCDQYFLYVEGGECTRYGREFNGPDIIPIFPQQARCWYNEHIVPLISICEDRK